MNPEAELITVNFKQRFGERIGGELAIKMYREAKEVIDDNPAAPGFIFDLKGIEFMDSSGLGGLVALNTRIIKQGKTVVFKNFSKYMQDISKITNLDKIFKPINDA